MGIEQIRQMKSEAGQIKPKKYKPIPKQSKKKIAQIKAEKEAYIENKPTGSLELQRWFLERRTEMKGFCQHWFLERRTEMKGFCQHCGGKTEKDTDNFRCSIAHILEKSTVKSVATHPSNWLELCFYGNSCHTNLDNKRI